MTQACHALLLVTRERIGLPLVSNMSFDHYLAFFSFQKDTEPPSHGPVCLLGGFKVACGRMETTERETTDSKRAFL